MFILPTCCLFLTTVANGEPLKAKSPCYFTTLGNQMHVVPQKRVLWMHLACIQDARDLILRSASSYALLPQSLFYSHPNLSVMLRKAVPVSLTCSILTGIYSNLTMSSVSMRLYRSLHDTWASNLYRKASSDRQAFIGMKAAKWKSRSWGQC